MKCAREGCSKHWGPFYATLSAAGNLKFCSKKCAEQYKTDRDKRLQEEMRVADFLRWLRLKLP